MHPETQFLKYVPVTGEKYLGLAYVRYLGKIILLYKVMASQDGPGYWCSPGSAKTGVKRDGKDNYESWFRLDSSYDSDEMQAFILSHVEPILHQSAGSVFRPHQNPSHAPHTPNLSHAQQQVQYPQPQQPYQQQAAQQGYLPNTGHENEWGNPGF